MGDGVVHLSTPTRFIKQWLQEQYAEMLLEMIREEFKSVRQVQFSVRGALRPKGGGGEDAAPPATSSAVRPVASRPQTPLASRAGIPDGTGTPPTQAAPVAASADGITPDPRFTLDTFEEGPSNAFALAAARQVIFCDPQAKLQFNPLYIHAPVGCGKTHLLQAVANGAPQIHPGRRVLYLTAEHFMYRFVAALKANTAIAFKEVLRDIDILLMDDLQFLHGSKVQEEFCHTMNALLDSGRQMVIAADRAPVELDGLDGRMRSRLSGGLVVEVGAPDYALRRRILQRRVAAQQVAFPTLEFPDAVLDFVARVITANGRELDGAVNRLVARNQYQNEAITVELAEDALRDLLKGRETRRLKIEDIQRVICQHYNISKSDLLSARRTKAIVRPRQVAMHLCKVLTLRSLPEIGRRFGNRDHTTVLHAVRKVDALIQEDKQIAEDVETLKRILEG
jgi:chromosomal replication initiator protein